MGALTVIDYNSALKWTNFAFVYKIPYRRAPRLAYCAREQRYLAYKFFPFMAKQRIFFLSDNFWTKIKNEQNIYNFALEWGARITTKK